MVSGASWLLTRRTCYHQRCSLLLSEGVNINDSEKKQLLAFKPPVPSNPREKNSGKLHFSQLAAPVQGKDGGHWDPGTQRVPEGDQRQMPAPQRGGDKRRRARQPLPCRGAASQAVAALGRPAPAGGSGVAVATPPRPAAPEPLRRDCTLRRGGTHGLPWRRRSLSACISTCPITAPSPRTHSRALTRAPLPPLSPPPGAAALAAPQLRAGPGRAVRAPRRRPGRTAVCAAHAGPGGPAAARSSALAGPRPPGPAVEVRSAAGHCPAQGPPPRPGSPPLIFPTGGALVGRAGPGPCRGWDGGAGPAARRPL